MIEDTKLNIFRNYLYIHRQGIERLLDKDNEHYLWHLNRFNLINDMIAQSEYLLLSDMTELKQWLVTPIWATDNETLEANLDTHLQEVYKLELSEDELTEIVENLRSGVPLVDSYDF